MKTLALAALFMASFSAHAVVTDCEQDTTLNCNVTYWKSTAPGRSTKVEAASTAKLTLVNEDEPSLAYCEARNGFTMNGFYIEATYLPATKKLNIRMMRERDASGGYHTDQASSTVTLKYGEAASASLSLAGTTAENFYAAEITCKLEQ